MGTVPSKPNLYFSFFAGQRLCGTAAINARAMHPQIPGGWQLRRWHCSCLLPTEGGIKEVREKRRERQKAKRCQAGHDGSGIRLLRPPRRALVPFHPRLRRRRQKRARALACRSAILLHLRTSTLPSLASNFLLRFSLRFACSAAAYG